MKKNCIRTARRIFPLRLGKIPRIITIPMLLLFAGFMNLNAAGSDSRAETALNISGALPQVQEITGIVTDENGTSLPGANVVVEGTTVGTITNLDGNYSIEAAPGSRLIFSFIGYQDQIIEIDASMVTVNVQLEVGMIELERVVKIGYGTQKAKDLTGSITSVDIEDMVSASDISVMQALQGTVAGLNVGQVDVAGEEPAISIRGRSSLSGENDPLIVIDDIIYRGNIIDINPSDIKTIDVLKDASASAIYGSQASNGVILITTTKTGGRSGTPDITFRGQYSFQRPWKELRAQGPEEFMQKIEHSDIDQSRLPPDYLQRNPAWDETTNFKTNHEIDDHDMFAITLGKRS